MNGKRIAGLALVGLGLVLLTLKISHVYDPAPVLLKLSAKGGPRVSNFVRTTTPDLVVYVVLVGLPICIGGLLLAASKTASGAISGGKAAAEPTPLVVQAKRPRAGKSYQSCNVLRVGPFDRHVWQFDARNGGFALNREQVAPNGESLSSVLVAKDWRSLFQRKLNVACLPPEHVFLRAAQFPASEATETRSMVELQLEKLSPIPVAQIVWSIHALPHTGGNMQTVIIIIVARDVVEEFLGQLEGQGFLADALELPILDQLQATPAKTDGVWIYPEALGGKNAALAAWWSGGVLHNLDLLNLPATNRSVSLREQITQMAWAGELEGWLTAPPRWHLVASGQTAADWEPVLRDGLDQPVEVLEPLPAPRLAAATAQRAVSGQANVNLLPAEFATRYHQQFVDRLWMGGLFALAALYMAGVAIYLVALGVADYRTGGVEAQVSQLANSYTNVIQLKTKLSVLTERQDLKFAALDCWRAVAELMPETLTLENCNFSDGKRFMLNGTAPSDEIQKLYDFDTALRKYVPPNKRELLFDPLKSEVPTIRQINPTTINWNLSLELKRSETR